MIEEFSTEERLRRIRRAWPLWVGLIVKSVTEKYGEEGQQVIMEALYNQGLMQGHKAVLKDMNPERNIRGIADTLMTLGQVMGMEFEIRDFSEKSFKLITTHCPMAERWKVVGAPPQICNIWGQYILGMLRAIHPKFEYGRLKSIYRGDPYCEEIWEIKE